MPRRLRPIDLARSAGLSTQAVRNYEDAGILPAADRTASGYRVYDDVHLRALQTFVALVRGHGHTTATAIMRAVNAGRLDEALVLVDASHAELHQQRDTLASVEKALTDLAREDAAGLLPDRPLRVGRLARRLGVRAATLRNWEKCGLLRPVREAETGYRVYSPEDVRDAEFIRMLRRGGYLLDSIRPVIEELRGSGGLDALHAVMAERRRYLGIRARSMLEGAARLWEYAREMPVRRT